VLTEQGDLLFRTAQEVLVKLEKTKVQLTDSREKPSGELKVSTTVGLGSRWLVPRLREFMDLYPDIHLNLILTDEELDLSMRAADVAIRVRQPVQPDLIQRKLFTINFHAYANSDYIKKFGMPKTSGELDGHRLLAFGGRTPNYMQEITWLQTAGAAHGSRFAMTINNITGLVRAVESGLGIAVLPDYLVPEGSGLVRVMSDETMPALDTPKSLKMLHGCKFSEIFWWQMLKDG
jgi:DNA-binding transcriptional LysR family regulator